MGGPQFMHLQTFSMKANPVGQSIAQIIGEATRDPQFSVHIDSPSPPVLLHGMDLDNLAKAHDAMVHAASTEVRLKNGTTARRAIRKDRHTLATMVASYPVPLDKIEQDKTGQERALYNEWKRLNLDYLRRKFGDQLATVVEHTDEPFGHIHAFMLPTHRTDADARSLSPAYEAKRQVENEVKAILEKRREPGSAPEKGEAMRALKAGNQAYTVAARDMVDEYYREVGAPAGLTREGPKRRRLSRSQWLRETTDARASSRLALEAQKNKAQDEARKEAQAILQTTLKGVDEKAWEILRQADTKAEHITIEADVYAQITVEDANEKAETILKTAEAQKRKAQEEAEKQAQAILEAARKEADVQLNEIMDEAVVQAEKYTLTAFDFANKTANDALAEAETILKAAEVQKRKAQDEAEKNLEAVRALTARLEPLQGAVAALDAWEAETAQVAADKELAAWWAMTPQERVKAMAERRREAYRQRAPQEKIDRIEAELDQLRAEAGTIVRVTWIDHDTGDIDGQNLRTGEEIQVRVVLTENERIEHYPDPDPNKNYRQAQVFEAQRALSGIQKRLSQVVVGSVVHLGALRLLTHGLRIAAFAWLCDPPRRDPRTTPKPMPEAAKPAAALPQPLRQAIRDAGPSGP